MQSWIAISDLGKHHVGAWELEVAICSYLLKSIQKHASITVRFVSNVLVSSHAATHIKGMWVMINCCFNLICMALYSGGGDTSSATTL